MVAGDALADEAVLARGLELLDFLLRVEVRDGHLSVTPVGRSRARRDRAPASTSSRSRSPRSPTPARPPTGSPATRGWLAGVDLAWRWFLGENDSVTSMFDPATGGGYDGLERDGSQREPGRGVHAGHAVDRAAGATRRRAPVNAAARAPRRRPISSPTRRGWSPGCSCPASSRTQERSRAGGDRRPGAGPRRGRGGAAGRRARQRIRRRGTATCSALLIGNASIVAARVDDRPDLSAARTLVLGASFTAEYATEAAALCNPSAVAAPRPDRARSRGSCGWRSACAPSARGTSPRSRSARRSSGRGRGGPSTHRDLPIVAGETAPARWRSDQLRAVLADHGRHRRTRQHACCTTCRSTSTRSIWSARWPRHPATCSPASVVRPRSTWCAGSSPRRTGWTFRRTRTLAQRVLRPSRRRGEQRHGGRPVHPVRRRRRQPWSTAPPTPPTTAARSRRGCCSARTCGSSAPTGWPGRPPGTRAWRCSPGWSTAGTWRCAAPTARTSAWPSSPDGLRWAAPAPGLRAHRSVGDDPGGQLRPADRDRPRLARAHPRGGTDAHLRDRRDPARPGRPGPGHRAAAPPAAGAGRRRAGRLRPQRRLLLRRSGARRAAVAALRHRRLADRRGLGRSRRAARRTRGDSV